MSNSMYSEYIKERTNDKIIETPEGFATYRYLENTKSVYILDIYVKPESRKSHIASEIANKIASEAKKQGYTSMLGSVVPSNKGSTASLKVLLGYGMSLDSSTNDLILFKKEL